jgi:hypothetical protein
MKQLIIIVFLAYLLFFASCSDVNVVLETQCPKYVELNFSNYNSLNIDPITIISTKVNGDILELTLQYGGGCQEHQVDLALIQPECGTPPLPPPTFEVRHNANGDVCKALITNEYSFNISGIREKGKNKTDFVLNTRDSSGITSSNTYTYTY